MDSLERTRGKHVLGERCHDFSSVRLDDSRQTGDTSGKSGFNEEAENTKHGKTSVVDFDFQSTGLLLVAGTLAESEGVEQVEWDRVGKIDGVEVGEVTRLSSSHVMLVVVGAEFTPKFQEEDEPEDLPLRVIGDFVPKLRRVVSCWERSSIHHHWPREFDSVGVDNVSNEGKHGNTSVLDFGVSEESDSGIVSLFPEVPGRKTKRIVVLDGRVQVAGQCLQIGLRRLQLSGRGRSTGAGEGGGGCGGGKEDGGGGLHGGILVLIRIMTTLWYYLN
mmetsp:Transcript_2468/g.5536  ORF Transcript_2468/g.5536 Transcript_2468/m.5536 type:complete len:275 (-) Transcript_2468:531-1355(-)